MHEELEANAASSTPLNVLASEEFGSKRVRNDEEDNEALPTKPILAARKPRPHLGAQHEDPPDSWAAVSIRGWLASTGDSWAGCEHPRVARGAPVTDLG